MSSIITKKDATQSGSFTQQNDELTSSHSETHGSGQFNNSMLGSMRLQFNELTFEPMRRGYQPIPRPPEKVSLSSKVGAIVRAKFTRKHMKAEKSPSTPTSFRIDDRPARGARRTSIVDAIADLGIVSPHFDYEPSPPTNSPTSHNFIAPPSSRKEATGAGRFGESLNMGSGGRGRAIGSNASTESSASPNMASYPKGGADSSRIRFAMAPQASVPSSMYSSFNSNTSDQENASSGSFRFGKDPENEEIANLQTDPSKISVSTSEAIELLNRKTLEPKVAFQTQEVREIEPDFQPYLLESLRFPLNEHIHEEPDLEDDSSENGSSDSDDDRSISAGPAKAKHDQSVAGSGKQQTENALSTAKGANISTPEPAAFHSVPNSPTEPFSSHQNQLTSSQSFTQGQQEPAQTNSTNPGSTQNEVHTESSEQILNSSSMRFRLRKRDNSQFSIGRGLAHGQRGLGTSSATESATTLGPDGSTQSSKNRLRERLRARVYLHQCIDRARSEVNKGPEECVSSQTVCAINYTPKQQERFRSALEKLAKKKRKQRNFKPGADSSILPGLNSPGTVSSLSRWNSNRNVRMFSRSNSQASGFISSLTGADMTDTIQQSKRSEGVTIERDGDTTNVRFLRTRTMLGIGR